MRRTALALAAILISLACSHAQDRAPSNRYGLHVVSSKPAYLATVRANPHNRQLLQDAMTAHGFQLFASEWWHFDYSGWQSFDLMDVPLEQLP